MNNCGIDSRYFQLLKDIYTKATAQIKFNNPDLTEKFRIQRGIRQGDCLIPKLVAWYSTISSQIFIGTMWELHRWLLMPEYIYDVIMIEKNEMELTPMRGINLSDRKTNVSIRKQTGVKNIVQ